MDIAVFIAGIVLLLIIAGLDSLRNSASQKFTGNLMHNQKEQFIISFREGAWVPAIKVAANAEPQKVIDAFGLITPRPTLFISGGASAMTEEDIQRTRILMDTGIAAFAEKHNITVIDGGTEAGVMNMIGEAREKNKYSFPLIGVAPVHKISYPGYVGHSTESTLQSNHSHFVLVDADDWGGESNMIVGLAKALAASNAPIMGILINGGQIAEREVYLATSQGLSKMPLLVVDGSGRTADNISTAFKTQQTDSSLIQAIIKGDIRLTSLADGVPALVEQLEKEFVTENSQP
jgi:SLOG in TRPM, prokaryote